VSSGLVTLTFDLLTLNVVSESRVTWATSVQILVFLGLSVLDLGPMYATDGQTDRRQTSSDSIIALCLRLLGAGHNKLKKWPSILHYVMQRSTGERF